MTENANPGQAQPKKWWQRPITWIMTIVVGAVGAYATNALVSGLESVAPTDDLVAQMMGTDAFKIHSLKRLHDTNSGGREGYVVPANADVAPVLEGSDERGFNAWTEANNAVDLGFSAWEMTIEGTRESTAEIVNIVPVLEAPCGAPLGGGLFLDGGQGAVEKVTLLADFNAAQPVMSRPAGPGIERIPNFFATHKITLPRNEKNTLVLRAKVTGKHCKFRYRIEYLADGKQSEFMLGRPDGRPFEISGYLGDLTQYSWARLGVGCRGGDPARKLQGEELAVASKTCSLAP
ncbi:hypothetical protein [Catelliglobosispora koreensis]|uniref:hypothetical protein n=1 Tax=Catelliglobosispora koreensis TaxID=129052 RepID=UPI00035DD257|nr:hypothetical protein [Catelliglobosispora koreensis]